MCSARPRKQRKTQAPIPPTSSLSTQYVNTRKKVNVWTFVNNKCIEEVWLHLALYILTLHLNRVQ